MKTKIGFVGLGNMGMHMAKNLIEAGYHLQVYNRTHSKTSELEQGSITACKTPAEAAEGVSILVSMLSEDEILRETVIGENGILKTFPKNAVHISMSTIGPIHRKNWRNYTPLPVAPISPPLFSVARKLQLLKNFLFAYPAMPQQRKSQNRYWNALVSVLLISAKRLAVPTWLKLPATL